VGRQHHGKRGGPGRWGARSAAGGSAEEDVEEWGGRSGKRRAKKWKSICVLAKAKEEENGDEGEGGEG